MTFLQSKLVKKYVFISLIVSICSLIAIYVITFQVTNQSVQTEIEYRNELMAKTISKKTTFIVSNIINDMKIISNQYVHNVENEGQVDLSEAHEIVSRSALYSTIALFDHNGHIIKTTPETPLFAEGNPFTEMIERVSWSKTFYISPLHMIDGHRPVITVTYPALNKNNELVGGVISVINLHSMSRYLNQVKIGDGGMNVLIDRGGNIVAHNKEEYIGQKINSVELIENLRKSRFGIWEGRLFNHQMIFAYRPTEIGNFGLIVGEPVSQALHPATQVQTLLLKAFILIVVITVIITLITTSSVVKPIHRLIRQVQEYKDHQRESFEIMRTNDEIEDLVYTMDDMAKELKDNEKRLYHILQSIPYAVITMDQDGRIITYNRGAEELTLFTAEEVIGKQIIDIPLRASEAEFLSWKTLKEGKQFNEVETKIMNKNGEKHDVRLYSSLFYDEKNQNIGAILILRDVSDIKKLEDHVRQTERLASLGQLTAGIAHEIKNPLSIIQAAAEAIQLEVKDEMEDEYIESLTEDILETTERLDILLTDFLKMAKDDRDFTLQPVDVVPVVEELISLLRKKFTEHDITVTKKFEGNRAIVQANENKLAQLFLNIMLNSVQAMEAGGDLTIQFVEKEDNWTILFTDSGIGIDEKKIKWIFNPFYTTKSEGTGLGLSIVHEIIQQLNGHIGVESELGKGTTMWVELPKRKGALHDE
ncbi:ATP-binding protein [Anaerobacillus sp. MEB173]|uniref:sensor histidine kinase n=1 Tax=Anaerobacillus sp. MEB173 TaxID=3383345 RepID=UPI003F8FCA40